MPTLVMNQSAANELIDQYSSIVDNFLQGENSYLSIDSIISKLKEEKEKAEELALQAYHLLGYNGNNLKSIESQINKRIQELQVITHCFNGVDLEKCFISSLEKIPAFDYDEQIEFDKFIKVIEQKSIQEIQNQESNFINDMYQELRPYIAIALSKSSNKNSSGFNTVKISDSGMIYSEKGYKVGTFNKTLALCGKNIRLGFREWVRNGKKYKNIDFKDTDNIENNSLKMDFVFEGEEGSRLAMSFMRMTKEKRENLFAANPGLQEQIIITFKEEIIRQCNVPSQYEPMLRNAINRVSGLKVGSLDAFFGKTNASSLTGILGEIQGLFYINVLLNENNNNNNATSKWIGGLNNPHADLLLREACNNYGIQVKNTASYLGAKKEIEFRSFGVSGWKDNERTMTYINKHDGFFNFNNSEEALRDMQAMGLPNDLSEAVQNFLLMKTFNVEYEWQDGKAVQGPNGNFHRTRVTIESYADRCQKVMSAFITSLLYMQVANISVAGGEANTLYLIAGELIVSAATIISNLIDELDGELRSFKMSMKTSSSSDINSQYTIVDVINKDYNNKLKKGSGISVRNLHFGFQSSFTFAY